MSVESGLRSLESYVGTLDKSIATAGNDLRLLTQAQGIFMRASEQFKRREISTEEYASQCDEAMQILGKMS